MEELRIRIKSLQEKKKTFSDVGLVGRSDVDMDSWKGDTSINGLGDGGLCGRIDEELEAVDFSIDSIRG